MNITTANKNLSAIKEHWEKLETVSLKDENLRELEISSVQECLRELGKIDALADVGCNNASDTIHWCDYAKEVFGYDYSQTALSRAKANFQDKINLSQLDLLNGNFDRTFNAVITKRCLINFGSWDNQKQAILKIHDSLKEGGCFIMLECCIDGLNILNQMRQAVGLEPLQEPHHDVYFELDTLKDFMSEYFDIERMKYFSMYYFLTRVHNPAACEDNYEQYDGVAKLFDMSLDCFKTSLIGPQFLMMLRKK